MQKVLTETERRAQVQMNFKLKPKDPDSVKALQRRIEQFKERKRREREQGEPLTDFDLAAIAARLTRKR